MDRKIGLGVAFGVALGIAAPALAQEALQWRVEDGGNGHWYQARQAAAPISWTEASSLAATFGGHLATLTTQWENTWVFNQIASPTVLWNGPQGPYLGGFRNLSSGCGPGCGWAWVTGEVWGFASWDLGEPSGGTEAFLHFGNGNSCWCPGPRWNDIDNTNPGWPIRAFIVEWSADCNSDGNVDYGQILDGTFEDTNSNGVPDCCDAGTPCTSGNDPVQWRIEDGGNGHWYASALFTDGPEGITWNDARSYARGRGGDLTSLETQSELEWVYERLGSKPSLWWFNTGENDGPYLGGLQDSGMPGFGEPSGGWRWLTGVPITVGSWGKGAPNDAGGQDFLHFWVPGPGRAMTFDDVADVDIGGSRSLIIEWSADCNGDGIVDYGQILQGQLVDADSNGVPDICEVDPCPGDVVESGSVNGIDLAAILANWGTDGGKFPRTDANGDGTVDANDLAIVLSGWGNCP